MQSAHIDNQMVTVFSYDDYRRFLKDLYLQAKAKDRKYSFRYFARLAGFQSPNFLKRVIDGDRNLTLDSIEKLIKALKLNKEEATFFKNLVLLNQAKTIDERQNYATLLLKSTGHRKTYPLKASQFNYYAHWYFVPIREMVGLPNFAEDYAAIGRQLIPQVPPAATKNAIEQLLKLGLLQRNAEGKLVQSEADIQTDQLTSASLARFHREMAQMAGDSIERVPREKRQISSVTLGLSKSSFEKISEMVKEVQLAIVEAASQEPHPEKIYQINFQVFPLTDEVKGENK